MGPNRKVKLTHQGVALFTTVFRHPFSYLHEQGLQLWVNGVNEIIQFVWDILCCRKEKVMDYGTLKVMLKDRTCQPLIHLATLTFQNNYKRHLTTHKKYNQKAFLSLHAVGDCLCLFCDVVEQILNDSLLCAPQQYRWSDSASRLVTTALPIMSCKNLRWPSPICCDMFLEQYKKKAINLKLTIV